jgi:hypothetical protein
MRDLALHHQSYWMAYEASSCERKISGGDVELSPTVRESQDGRGSDMVLNLVTIDVLQNNCL